MAGLTPDRDLAFVRFVRERELWLTRLAVLLAGSHSAGQDLLQDALESTYRRWAARGEIEDFEAYVRVALANAARGSWRKRAADPKTWWTIRSMRRSPVEKLRWLSGRRS